MSQNRFWIVFELWLDPLLVSSVPPQVTRLDFHDSQSERLSAWVYADSLRLSAHARVAAHYSGSVTYFYQDPTVFLGVYVDKVSIVAEVSTASTSSSHV